MPAYRCPYWRTLWPLASLLFSIGCGSSSSISDTPPSVTLALECREQPLALICRALLSEDSRARTDNPIDVTDAANWSTTDQHVVAISGDGRLTARAEGMTRVTAAVIRGGRSLSSSVDVVVKAGDSAPRLGYALEGEVRDVSNRALTNVDLALGPLESAPGVAAWTAISRDGEFRFAAVTAGTYILRATLPHHRSVQRQVEVPNKGPLTVVLLADALP